jgi:ATP-dependent exoDNAse (exonuclease V) beta subunit
MMGHIDIISASAGSGKTTHLANLLLDEVRSGRIRPQAILATTFTQKSAAELEQRVRTKLLSENQAPAALALQGARMGTVNSVCGKLVADFAFELGLSPELRVLDENLAAQTLRQCLSRVVTDAESEELAQLSERMKEFDWSREVHRIIDLARSNGLPPEALAKCAQRSIADFASLLAKPLPESQGPVLDAALKRALERFISGVDTKVDKTKATAEALERAREADRILSRGHSLPWKEWLALAGLKPGAKSKELAEELQIAALAQDEHPRLLADVSRAITLTFDIAARGLLEFKKEKRAWGVIDFVDQEVLALALLEREDARAQLSAGLDLVLVDEFQDTSPLQLAIFLRLSELAKRSVWVGDQKQAIYGFRGTDPSLMDAAIASVLRGAEPRTLSQSWRSRPELVRVTSALFTPPFELHGLPASRVALTPGVGHEPPGLGPVAEHWMLQAKNKGEEVKALAAGIQQLLQDPEAVVRVGQTGTRRVLPGDVAVLCRSNDECTLLAHELEALGLRAVLPRSGLVASPEAQVALAGLRLFIDSRDTLAAAQLARAIHYPEDGDGWLTTVLHARGDALFHELPFFVRLRKAREALPTAGAIAALDAVVEAVQLRELCLSWGDKTVRLANLDQLRAHAVMYVESCLNEGRGATPAGLLAHFEAMEAEGEDTQAAPPGEDAVVVSTWHRAKGLEWPVTVLYGIASSRQPSALGTHVVSDRQSFDLASPLAERWLRFWPTPYDKAQKGAPFHVRLEEHAATKEAARREERQELRLLYVGWTRARDRVVLAARQALSAAAMLSLLSDAKGPLLTDTVEGQALWAGQSVVVGMRAPEPQAPVEREAKPEAGHPLRAPVQHPPAFLSPSTLEGRGRVLLPERLGERAPLTGEPEMADLGQAVHGFLAADRHELSAEQRLAIATRLLSGWGVRAALKPEALLGMGESLRRWVEARAPGAVWHREWPLHYTQPDGTVLRGSADLVLETSEGLLLIDHKSFPGAVTEALARAEGHAGQLAAYARALNAATRRAVLGCFIHLPLSGMLVPVELPADVQEAIRAA